ncbi:MULTISPECIES: ABC transporter permease [Thermotoga]|uniref:Inner-membrane translocator n=2 Tax=Thermotoga petrophila TaxID=93929 RepID=D2C550_THEP2|nr:MULTISPECIES: ribose ABC transporter permease [Thermotoga]KUK22682.1 MAG: Monosaccharide-transporting ATPase [Thermotoga petrophila]ADA67854.1 inner-membrane translocator [Thermotoga petrophila RKU-10]KHC93213.1 inner-membrane translocator [Thermotoga sp. TBGT1765]KHC94621.1 inner-membrane translocator [Thermotoga sp. TBGT1766]KHC95936.1 inner-membrane translocator [Thermotoga sp. Xyl54]
MKKIWNLMRRYPVVVGFVALLVALSILSDRFLTISNLLNVLRQVSVQAIIAFGMTIVIISGGIDLSVGSVFAFSAVVLASILKQGSIFLAMLAGLGVGALFGLFNGFVIAKAKLQPFIVTLATMAIARSFTLLYTNGMPITGFSDAFRFIGRGEIFSIPVPVFIMFGVFFLTWYLLSQTKLGLYAYSIGGNEEATRLSGVNVDRYKIIFYVISGVYSAVSAMILTARLNSAQPIFGQGYELDAIAAVVLGGASLSGGKGTVFGTLFGALIMGIINNGLNLLNVSPFYQQAVKGSIILAAVLLEREK